MNKIKNVLIGLDGGTFNLITPLIKENKLKNFARLMQSGSYGVLESTTPPITSPAWISLLTGKDPGELSLFGFRKFNLESKKSDFVNSRMIKDKRIWNYLAPNFESCIVNVPMTYPPQEIPGDLITGMMTPSKSSIFTFPSDLKGKLPEDYIPECTLTSNPGKNIKLVQDMFNARINAIKYLIKNRPKDFMFFVIRGTDVLQHKFWHEKDVLNDFLELVDTRLGEIFDLLNKSVNIFIISDHGFGFKAGNVNINTWLEQKGYLKRKSAPNKKSLLLKMGISKKQLKTAASRLGIASLAKKFMPKKIISKIPDKGGIIGIDGADIDWKATKAIAIDWAIYLTADRNSNEFIHIRNQIMKELKDILNPITQQPVLVDLSLPEEVFSQVSNDAPAILISFEKDGYDIGTTFGHQSIWSLYKDGKTGSGTHRKEGIFIACGPDIKKNFPVLNAKITDILPTILTAFKLPSPDGINGATLDIFTERGMKR
ncbi:alkaline phosphatase family protein [Candidatus Woesearchaeota archaeon]|nr:alkaline phosphatase family protein [Candidatus Woesearchaeota archaeon]MBW2994236.1 alkaline phosphatase family protein [Candidatus Woesearchaeota archaeon]